MRGKQIKKARHKRERLTSAEGGNAQEDRLGIVQPLMFFLRSLLHIEMPTRVALQNVGLP